jgi:hypothetical protein
MSEDKIDLIMKDIREICEAIEPGSTSQLTPKPHTHPPIAPDGRPVVEEGNY